MPVAGKLCIRLAELIIACDVGGAAYYRQTDKQNNRRTDITTGLHIASSAVTSGQRMTGFKEGGRQTGQLTRGLHN